MKFLPYESFAYKTRLTQEEIIRRISENTEPVKNFRFGMLGGGSGKIYEGEVGINTFRIRRIINYKNSFLPRIDGVVGKGIDGLRVNVKMRLSTFVIVFLCFWCSISGFICMMTLPAALSKPEFEPEAFIPCGMLVFVYAMTMGAFKYESIKSKNHLRKMFEAEIVQQ